MRKGTRLNGKANSGELLIKSVMSNKPKLLTGLGQNGKWSVNPVRVWITGTLDHRMIGRA
jgi:hypothetical protein